MSHGLHGCTTLMSMFGSYTSAAMTHSIAAHFAQIHHLISAHDKRLIACVMNVREE